MNRDENLKRFDIKTRNQLRAILSDRDGNAINRLVKLSAKLGKSQVETLNAILNSSVLTKAVKVTTPFPKKPPFFDIFQLYRETSLSGQLSSIERKVRTHKSRLKRLASSINQIDELYAEGNLSSCIDAVRSFSR